MSRKLKASLRKNQLTEYSNDYVAQILERGSMNTENIIDELLNDGVELNRKMALDIINSFNAKVSDLVLSGFNVNTGLISIHPVIKGTLNAGKWNSKINTVSVSISESYDLRQAISETLVEVKDDNGESYIINSPTEIKKIKGFKIEPESADSSIETDNTACGIAFRKWLFEP